MNYKQLTENERYQIYVLLKAGHTQKEISDVLGRNPSTICRELKRNKGLRGYRPAQAHRLFKIRQSEAIKAVKITDEIWGWIVTLIQPELSPQQVVDYLKRHKNTSLHHETIYQFIYLEKAHGKNFSKI